MKFTDHAKAQFLLIYAETANFTAAARAVGIAPVTVAEHRKVDPEFDLACQHAQACYRDKVAEHARDLIMNGVERPIMGGRFKDKIVAHETVFPTALIQMELRRTDPDYRDHRQVDHNVKGGVLVAPANVEPTDWARQLKDHSAKTIDVESQDLNGSSQDQSAEGSRDQPQPTTR